MPVTDTHITPPTWRLAAAFAILFVVYQSAEGIGDKLLHSFAVQAVLMVAAVLVAWPLGRWLGYRGYDAWGLDLRPRSFALLAALMLLAIGAKATALLAGAAIGVYTIAPATMPGPGAATGALALMLVSTFFPSVAEDMLTRGFFLRAANRGFSGPGFVLLTAAVFAANHIYRYDWGWSEQARLFVEGCAYAAAAWRWRTLWGAVALHWGYNFAGLLFDPLVTAADASDAGRWLTVGVHVVILVIVLLVPPPHWRRHNP
jgi:membrane protease YdiL (CAAX protease family)